MSDFQLDRTVLSRGSRNASDALADAQRPTLRTSIKPPNTVSGIMEALRYASEMTRPESDTTSTESPGSSCTLGFFSCVRYTK